MSEKMSPFDLAANINKKTGFLFVDEVGFDPFIVNRVFSNTVDTVMFANEMNAAWHLPNDMQYSFLYFGIPKKNARYGPWHKKPKDDAGVKLIQEYYGYSRAKALDVFDLLEPHLDEIKESLEKGGRHGRKQS